MAVKITQKMATTGKGVTAYRFVITKNAKGDIRTYEQGRAVERDVREQRPPASMIERKSSK